MLGSQEQPEESHFRGKRSHKKTISMPFFLKDVNPFHICQNPDITNVKRVKTKQLEFSEAEH